MTTGATNAKSRLARANQAKGRTAPASDPKAKRSVRGSSKGVRKPGIQPATAGRPRATISATSKPRNNPNNAGPRIGRPSKAFVPAPPVILNRVDTGYIEQPWTKSEFAMLVASVAVLVGIGILIGRAL